MATPKIPTKGHPKQTPQMIQHRTALLFVVVGAATFFALGWLAQSLLHKEPAESPKPQAQRDAGLAEPVLLFDASIDLLDGKQLQLDLPDKPNLDAQRAPAASATPRSSSSR